ncbi:MAG: prepilin-type N-terminal cleavage/methylation domain-containing protein [Firmicutes bacterium]|jgi:prepilin-type N-terminal cleavage/methylation domain-containing protein|nr:prepilin-type N-terminal cleavage/methylation domain-containing protein [Bacillota bacterium]
MRAVSDARGVGLVEVLVVIVILGIVGAFVYSGTVMSLRISEAGRQRVEAAALMGEVLDRVSEMNLGTLSGSGPFAYPSESRYSATYRVESTSLGVYRIEVEVSFAGETLSSGVLLVHQGP